jgi:hypothetical protein
MYRFHRSGLNTLPQTAPCHIPEDCNLGSVNICENFGCYFLKLLHFNCWITFWVFWSFTYNWKSLADEFVSEKLVCRDERYYRTESCICPRYLLSEVEDTTRATGKICEFWKSDCRSDWQCDTMLSIWDIPMFEKNMLPSNSSTLKM